MGSSVRRILDSSALLTGRQFPGELLTVPEVLTELRRHGITPQLQAVLTTQVALASPSRESIAKVHSAARVTGDLHRLSGTDIALVALALERQGTIVTDDYSIQNVGHALGIPFEPIMEPGIREQWTWTYRCTGCGKDWADWHEECPTCGAGIRTVRVTSSMAGGE